MPKLLWLNSFILALLASGCVTIPNTTACTVAGRLLDGGICAETLTGKTSEKTFEQMIDFLEPQLETPEHPARGGAICQSSEDYNKQKTALERACRLLGSRCSYELRQLIKSLTAIQSP
jgi:hypothetical protein